MVRIHGGAAAAVRALYVFAIFGLVLFTSRPGFAAYSSIVVDASTGQVLHANHPDRQNYPASLTKMMTLFLTFHALETGKITFNTRLAISPHAAAQAPSKLGLTPGDTLTVRQAILGIVTKSANDAAVVLAENLGGSETAFAKTMTETAHKLGMTNTEFHNASGLPVRHQLTTARDMATLARALLHDYPQYYHFFSTPEFTYDGLTFMNHNRLLKTYPGADGIKTGYIHASGFNLVASAKRDGRRLIGVVLGGLSPRERNRMMASLLDAGFLQTTVRAAALAPKPSLSSEEMVASAEPMVEPESAGQGDADDSDISPAAKVSQKPVVWGIQVGAFSRFAPAKLAVRRATRTAPRLLAHAHRSVETVADDDGKVFRARLMGLTERKAREACDVLAARKMECVAVTADHDVSVAATSR